MRGRSRRHTPTFVEVYDRQLFGPTVQDVFTLTKSTRLASSMHPTLVPSWLRVARYAYVAERLATRVGRRRLDIATPLLQRCRSGSWLAGLVIDLHDPFLSPDASRDTPIAWSGDVDCHVLKYWRMRDSFVLLTKYPSESKPILVFESLSRRSHGEDQMEAAENTSL